MADSASGASPSAAERGRRGLWLGILAYRWMAFGWMAVLAFTSHDFRSGSLYAVFGWAAIALAGLWTAWLTIARPWERRAVWWIDITLAVGLVLLSGYVVHAGDVGGGHPFFAASYPVAAVLAWGAVAGPTAGLLAGAGLCAGLALSRPLNALPLADLTSAQWQALVNGCVYYLSAGFAIGLVSKVLARSADEVREATEIAIRERERAARLAEREALAREIHDSVLQSLAMVHKRGNELASRPTVAGAEVGELALMAGREEAVLRSLILRWPEEAPTGKTSLRGALESLSYEFTAPPVTVTATGPIWAPAPEVDEVAAAVRQALENVAGHARARRASIFADEEDGEIVVAVRDDGVGFVYDEDRIREAGKLGMLKSMKGRVEGLGGAMRVTTTPGKGTEVEFRVPIRRGEADER